MTERPVPRRVRVTLEGSLFVDNIGQVFRPVAGNTMPHGWWMGHDMIVTAVEDADSPAEITTLRAERDRLRKVAEAARELRGVEGKEFGIDPALFHARQVLDAALAASPTEESRDEW